MKQFIANWLLSWADLIDTIVEILTFGLVLETDAAHVVYLEAQDALADAGWYGDKYQCADLPVSTG